MKTDEIIKLVKEGKIPVSQVEELSNRHSKRLCDIAVDLNSEALKCGFPTIEHHQYILDKVGNLVIIAARPGNGKTALACQIGLEVAKWGRTLYFSLEMTAESLRKRLLSVSARVPIKNLGLAVHSDKVQKAMHAQRDYKFDIVDDLGLCVQEIISKALDENRLEPINLVIIDYVGNLKVDNEKRHLAIAEAAKRLRNEVALPLKIPVLLLAQMNRDIDKRRAFAANKSEVRPNQADLADSSGLEHSADTTLFLERPCLSDPTAKETQFKVYVTKNRNGEVRDFEMKFIPSQTLFIDDASDLI